MVGDGWTGALEIPGYADLELVHRGRHHLIWHGLRGSDRSPVVLKTPAHQNLLAAVRHEHELLCALDVRGIVKPLAFEEAGRSIAVVLPSVGSRNLKEFLAHRALDIPTFLRLSIQIAEIVARLHAHDIVHRDIGLSNFVLSDDGSRLTLVDALAATVRNTPVRGVELKCDLFYVAPEQTGRLDRPVDRRSDLYAIGVSFYELLCGQVPFACSDPVELVHAHLARDPVPPALLRDSVPRALSDITVRLLRKMPEHRYQNADSLVADLREVSQRASDGGDIRPLLVGEKDRIHRLPAPGKLYGRERPLAELVGAFERAVAGDSEVVVVRGAAGIGKSALVRELDVRVGAERFLVGKCDSVGRAAPYASIQQAFGRFLTDLRAQAPEVIADWRAQLLADGGPSVAVLMSVLPELATLVGGRPPPVVVGPRQAERRFHLAFLAFARALARRCRPLVLFIDDLQWVDSATLELLRVLAEDPDSRHLLLVVAFRAEEIGTDHPVTTAVERFRTQGVRSTMIDLEPLAPSATTSLLADILRSPAPPIRLLGEVLHRRSAGNPLFVQRLLGLLADSGDLSFDTTRGEWSWDLTALERMGLMTDVVDVMLEAIRRLPDHAQHVLKIAACFAHGVDLAVLSEVLEQPPDAVAVELQAAIDRGLVTITDGTWGKAYRFVHDRVQQSAYSLLTEAERQSTHHRIGTLLLERTSEHDEQLFEAVDQLNLGAAGEGTTPVARAALNAQAAGKARAAAAYAAALSYLQRGIELLAAADAKGGTTSDDPRVADLRFRLHRDAAECAYLAGDVTLVERLATTALDLARTSFETASVCNIRIIACATRGAHREAIEWGRRGLGLFGLELPTIDLDQAIATEFGTVARELATRQTRAVLDLPRMTEPSLLASMELLANLISPCFVADQRLFAFLVVKMVDVSIRGGNSIYSAYAYGAYSMLLIAQDGAYRSAHELGAMAVELAERFGDPVQECRTNHVFGAFINHWSSPLATSVPVLRAAVKRGLDGGELQFAVYSQSTVLLTKYHIGVELPQILAELETIISFATTTNTAEGLHYELPYRQAARCLQGRTSDHARFDDATFSESAHLQSAQGNPVAVGTYWILRLQTAYLLRDLDAARAASEAALPCLPAFGGLYAIVEHNLYTSLTLAAAVSTSATERTAVLARIAANQRLLAAWAETCPDNFRAKHVLVAAELARLEGRDDDAADRYDEAIELAERAGFRTDQALANELAGRHWRAKGKRRIAAMYLRGALRAYARWGALAKVAALELEFPRETLDEPVLWREVGADGPGSALDLLGLLEAAETVGGEVVLSRLVEKLLTLCFELAGAERGALLMDGRDGLVVHARGSTTEPVVLMHKRLAESTDLPCSLVEHVWREDEPVVILDAAHHNPFSSDPHLERNQVRSVLALPIRRQSRSVGVVYLENNQASGVFSSDRVRVLQLLSSHIAIALENSLLFEQLRVEVEERKRRHQQAQDSIRVRDEFLSVASHELRTPITSLQLAVQALQPDGSPDQLARLCRIAQRQTKHLSSLVDQLLSVSRIQEGRIELALEEVDLAAVVRCVVERLAFQLERARCELVLDATGPVVGTWDKGRVDQVVTNLVANAIKFGAGRPIAIDVTRAASSARLTIADRGIGIPADRVPYIFERFERAVPASRYGGLGLGLYISKQIVCALGGAISVATELGVGSTFTVELPCHSSGPGGDNG